MHVGGFQGSRASRALQGPPGASRGLQGPQGLPEASGKAARTVVLNEKCGLPRTPKAPNLGRG